MCGNALREHGYCVHHTQPFDAETSAHHVSFPSSRLLSIFLTGNKVVCYDFPGFECSIGLREALVSLSDFDMYDSNTG
jgi:hypothetical protein